MNIPMLPQDKANHFVWGAFAALAGAMAAYALHKPQHAASIAQGLNCVVGAAKELSDYISNKRARDAGLPEAHEVSFEDFVATTIGGVPVTLACFMFA